MIGGSSCTKFKTASNRADTQGGSSWESSTRKAMYGGKCYQHTVKTNE